MMFTVALSPGNGATEQDFSEWCVCVLQGRWSYGVGFNSSNGSVPPKNSYHLLSNYYEPGTCIISINPPNSPER